MNDPIESCLVTGSSGFIGTHLCARLAEDGRVEFRSLDLVAPPAGPAGPFSRADIRSRDELRSVAATSRPVSMIHLAAKAEVEIPFDEIADLMETNVSGTAHLLETFRPRNFVFTSSSAVYGNGGPRPVSAAEGAVRPLGMYGVSKLVAEMVCREWAGRNDCAVVCLRLGNVVGRGCRGLIPYLVGHARKFPTGSVPARIRAQGRLVRDYVPVRHTVEVLTAILGASLEGGSVSVFNVGGGRGWTNGEIAALVQAELERHGHRLRIEADAPLVPGEAEAVVLEAGNTFGHFGVPAPGDEDVVRAIQEAVVHALQTALPDRPDRIA